MNQEALQTKRNPLPAIGLFFLAPLVAEYLLGNLPITLLTALILMAPLYGGGALLIRELVRRAGRGWPSIILLALAFGILEEAFTTQTLFNPNYMHLNAHLLDPAYIPALGIGGWWTVFVLALHTVWSISTPIALMEAAVPDRATTPWLGPIGLAITVILFSVGIVGVTRMGFSNDRYLASPAQFASSAVAIACLVLAAFLLRRPAQPAAAGWTPNPWMAGALALCAGSAILLIRPAWGWWAVAAILFLELGVAALVLGWANRKAWTMLHELALAAGAAFAYAWHAFLEKPVIGGTGNSVRVGNSVFALGAVALVAYAAKKAQDSIRAGATAPR